MKKLFCLLLTAALVLGMCACGGQEKDAETTLSLQVGFGREKFNPSEPVWISGGGNPNRISETFLDYLYVTCIALTDAEDNTVLVITADLQNEDVTNWYNALVEAVKSELLDTSYISTDLVLSTGA